MKYIMGGLSFFILSLVGFFGGGVSAYVPSIVDFSLQQAIDRKLDEITTTGGEERLLSIVSTLLERSQDVVNIRVLYILEYTLRSVATILKDSFSVPVVWDSLVDESLFEKQPSLSGGDAEESVMSGGVQSSVSVSETPDLQSFYETYKGFVTSDTPISELCTEYFDKIDAVAKQYDFPTSLIIATWYKEHTCIFSNPANGWGNFQITSHSYPAGAIDWADFENQIINFIIFSKAKREWYDSFQKYGPEPVALSYDTIDLTSLRKHAILYNGIRGTLEDNIYANQNFGEEVSGRDGIVAMTLRALGWQLEKTRDLGGVIASVVEVSPNCGEVFTENLGVDANHPQVLEMQKFLEKQGFYAGEPNGVYDERTLEAVNAFQAFYKKDILDPGGYQFPTGAWYPATRRKANSIVCGS